MNKSPLVNNLQAEDWSASMGERWLAHLDQFETMIAPLGAALMSRSAFGAGERVVDVGCGGGGTTIEIARAVGNSGIVAGVDISPALIARAAERARESGLGNIRFHCADAAAAQVPGAPFDRLFSRFGLMFFADPVAAFSNLRSHLAAGARADFSVWAPARENVWVAAMMAVFARHLELPTPVPHAPGPFAFDDPAYLRNVLREAGFGEVEIDEWNAEQLVGGRGASPETAADFALNVMSFGELVNEANPTAREPVTRELVELFSRYRSSAGIEMPAKAFLVTAQAR